VTPWFTTTYAVTCTGSGSATASAQVTVTNSPTALLSVRPTIINAGASTLAWNSANASACTGAGFVFSGPLGSTNVLLSATTTYGVTCSGRTIASATATVTPDQIAFSDTFAGPPASTECISDGAALTTNWRSVFSGFGCNQIAASDASNLFDGPAPSITPKTSTKRGETHSGLIIGPTGSTVPTGGNFTLETSTQTVQQLRSTPNAWEVAWLLWDYADNTHFYYFIGKPTGWEFGKEDPAYAGNQRFLATGTTPKFPIGQRYVVTVKQAATASATTLSIWVNGAPLPNPTTGAFPTFVDTERPYSGGYVGLYAEDARAYFPSVVVTTPSAN
jgi:hypothetical protein